MRKDFCWLFLFLCSVCSSYANEQLIIKYKPSQIQQKMLSSGQMTNMQVAKQLMVPLAIGRLAKLESFSGCKIKEVNQIGNGAHVVELQESNLSESAIQVIMKKIKASDSTIEYIEPNRVLKLMSLPSYNPKQWDMQGVTGDNFESMRTTWNSLFPNQSPGHDVIVAVIDSGYTPHSNFLSNLEAYNTSACTTQSGVGSQCYGYNFCINSPYVDCGNSVGYKPDALDWGDYTSGKDTSSWHGSHVTGIIVSNGYTNGQGILGGAYGAKVMPLRTLASRGGNMSDAANAILYAVNQYPGLTNPNKAQVINLSLGGIGNCYNTLQSTINTAINNGAIVVAAAGNSKCDGSKCEVYDVSEIYPANCAHVISVSAKGNANELAAYSSYGDTTITASGGNQTQSYYNNAGVCDSDQVCSNVWGSTKQYNYSDGQSYMSVEGTSQAAPHVSAAIADLISFFNNKGIFYNLSMITSILQDSASQLSNKSNYDAKTKGEGGSVSGLTLDANNALLYAESYANVVLPVVPKSWLVNSFTSQTFTFTNKSMSSVEIESSLIVSDGSLVNLAINNDSCSKTPLLPNKTCTITVAVTSYGVGSFTLELVDLSGAMLGYVPISVNDPQPITPSGGGGCSVTNNGNDYSLILILCVLSIFYCFKRKCFKR